MLLRLFLLSTVFGFASPVLAASGWLCEEAASIREGSILTLCGIGEDTDEDKARKLALTNAFAELDLLCNRSADCKDYELNIEPMRNECARLGDKYKCYRAVRADITTVKKVAVIPTEKRDEDLVKKEVEQEKQVTAYRCDYDTDSTLNLFADLTTPKKLDEAVKNAVKIPFRLACTKFHYQVFNVLERAKIVSPAYNNFLLTTVRSSITPDETHGAIEIVDYFFGQGVYDGKKWPVILTLFSRLTSGSMYRLAPKLFHTSSEDRALQSGRLDELMAEASKNKVGRPVPIPYDQLFATIARGLTDSPNAEKPWLAQVLFRKHFANVAVYEPEGLLSPLAKLYQNVKDRAEQREALKLMAAVINKVPADKVTAKNIYRVPEMMDGIVQKLDPETVKGEAEFKDRKAQQAEFLKMIADRADEVFGALDQKFEIKHAIDFCLELQLACPSVVPAAGDLKKMLTSQATEKRKLALDVIAKQPKVALSLQDDVFAVLMTETEKDSGSNHEVITGAVRALISAPVSDPVKIKRIFKVALNRQYNYEEVVEKLGAAATPTVLEIALDDRHPAQNTGMMMLKQLRKRDPKAQEALVKMAADTTRPDLQRRAKEALGEN